MTKMAAMRIYVKNPLKSVPDPEDLGTWYVVFGMWREHRILVCSFDLMHVERF